MLIYLQCDSQEKVSVQHQMPLALERLVRFLMGMLPILISDKQIHAILYQNLSVPLYRNVSIQNIEKLTEAATIIETQNMEKQRHLYREFQSQRILTVRLIQKFPILSNNVFELRFLAKIYIYMLLLFCGKRTLFTEEKFTFGQIGIK